METHGIDLGAPLQTRQEIIADRLRDAILRGIFRPGQRLDQNEIAQVFKVSRSPIREALRTLAAEGLVEVIPHHGAVVAELSLAEIEEILFLRGVLEGMAARLAVPKMGAEQIKALEEILHELSKTTDLDRWLQLNHRFHHAIYQCAVRPRLLALIDNLRNTITPYTREFIATTEHMREAAVSHQLIFEACVKRDALLAEQETHAHLAAVSKGIVIHARSQLSSRMEEQGQSPVPQVFAPFPSDQDPSLIV